MLQTIEKVGLVLDLFTTSRPEWSLSEIAAEVAVPRSSTHSLLSSLVKIGLLQSVGRGKYRIGWRPVELSEAHRQSLDPSTIGAAQLRSLGETTGETAHLAVLSRWQALYVQRHPGHQTVCVSGIGVGTPFDAHCSAVGKVLLAHRPTLEVERFVSDRPLRRLTASTITTASALADELAWVRAHGSGTDSGEMIEEVSCVAAPVRDEMGVVVAAIGISVPTVRFAEARTRLEDSVIAAAAAASARLVPTRSEGSIAVTRTRARVVTNTVKPPPLSRTRTARSIHHRGIAAAERF